MLRSLVLAGLATVLLTTPAAAGAQTPIADAAALDTECAGGKTVSCIHLGVLHRRGFGAEKDARRALTLFLDACEKGNALACAMLGDMTYRGEGVRTNAAHGETLMRAACVRRNEWSCESLRRNGVIKRRRAQS